MGMEHERIHLETSSVLIRQLPVEMVSKPKGWKYAPTESGKVYCLYSIFSTHIRFLTNSQLFHSALVLYTVGTDMTYTVC